MTIQLQILLDLAIAFYIVYTIIFSIQFYKTFGKLFEKHIRLMHLIIIWMVPILWKLLLKIICKNKYNKFKSTGIKYAQSNTMDNIDLRMEYDIPVHDGSNTQSDNPTDSIGHGWHGHDIFDFGDSIHHSSFGDSTDAGIGHH